MADTAARFQVRATIRDTHARAGVATTVGAVARFLLSAGLRDAQARARFQSVTARADVVARFGLAAYRHTIGRLVVRALNHADLPARFTLGRPSVTESSTIWVVSRFAVNALGADTAARLAVATSPANTVGRFNIVMSFRNAVGRFRLASPGEDADAIVRFNLRDVTPLISNVTATMDSPTQVTIRWVTDIRANTQVEWGYDIPLSPGGESAVQQLPNLSDLLTPPMLQHSVTLTGLVPSTTLYFRARSTA